MERPPDSSELDVRFAAMGADFSLLDFIGDLRFTLEAMNVPAESEALAYNLSSSIVEAVPRAFCQEWLTPPGDPEAHDDMVRTGLDEPRG